MLGQYKGVCRDELVGGMENNQLHTAVREDGVNTIIYRRDLISRKTCASFEYSTMQRTGLVDFIPFAADSGDREYKMEGSSQMIWAMGELFHDKEPSMHRVFPRGATKLELNRKEPINTCIPFVKSTTKIK